MECMMDSRPVLVLRSVPKNHDARAVRYQTIFSDRDVHFFCKEKVFRNNFANVLYYYFKLILLGPVFVKKYKIIIASDLDCFLLTFYFSIFKKHYYFDLVDPISCTKFREYRFFAHIFDLLEFMILVSLKRSILPGIIRLDYYCDKFAFLKPFKIYANPIIIENVPVFKGKTKPLPANQEEINSIDKLRVGYFGGLAEGKGIPYLLDQASKDDRIHLHIAGHGNLDNLIEKYEGLSNITFHGGYIYDELPDLLSHIDFIWSFYEPDNRLHAYALPNKFYEANYFKKFILMNSICPQSEYVRKNNIGVVLPDNLIDNNVSLWDFVKKEFGTIKDEPNFLSKYDNYYKNINKLFLNLD